MSDKKPVNTNESELAHSNYYFVEPNESFPPLRPALDDDLIRMYGLQDLAQAFLRVNPDGSKGVKLRKSYKSHISDLPGKHHIPPVSEDKSFTYIALMPDNPDFAKPKIEEFDLNYLNTILNFDKTGPNGIPGFDSSKLGLTDLDSPDKKDKKRKATTSASPEDSKRRHF